MKKEEYEDMKERAYPAVICDGDYPDQRSRVAVSYIGKRGRFLPNSCHNPDNKSGYFFFDEPLSTREIDYSEHPEWRWFAYIHTKRIKEENIKMRSPEEVRKELNEYAARIDPARLKPIPRGLKGKLVGELNTRFGGAHNRYYVIGWLFTGSADKSLHTSQLSDAQIAALLHWLAPKHEKDGWAKNPVFLMEASLMYAYVAKLNLQFGTMLLSQTLLDAIK